MPRLKLTRRMGGPIGIALTAYDIYRRLPPKQRKQVVALARKHGPAVAAKAARLYASRTSRRFR